MFQRGTVREGWDGYSPLSDLTFVFRKMRGPTEVLTGTGGLDKAVGTELRMSGNNYCS